MSKAVNLLFLDRNNKKEHTQRMHLNIGFIEFEINLVLND